MFIKKDLRKIPKILEDAVDCIGRSKTDGAQSADDDDHHATNGAATRPDPKRAKLQEPLKELRLGRRQQEFRGSLQILCQPEYLPKLLQLQSLNLYDCNISSIDGVGLFEGTPCLERLNLGRNPLERVPDELARVQSLKHVWMDDCRLRGSLPRPLLRLRNLESLRLPNNGITDIPLLGKHSDDDDAGGDDEDGDLEVAPLLHLQILCLDRNELQTLPQDLRLWTPNLKELMVRHNKLEGPLRCQLPPTLQVLHVSSNHLTSLDALVDGAAVERGVGGEPSSSVKSSSQCPHLTHLYANGNQLESLPDGILSRHPKLRRLLVSHNPPLSQVPDEFWDSCGGGGDCDGDGQDVDMVPDRDETSPSSSSPTVEIMWQPNPSLVPPPGLLNSRLMDDT